MKFKKIICSLTVLLLLMVLTAPPAVFAEAYTQQNAQEAALSGLHTLKDSLQVEVKSLYSESPSNETRIGAVVRVYNQSAQYARLSELQLYVKTSEGIVYELSSSATNAASVRPYSREELSYMTVLSGSYQLDISELQLVDVDEYVYPKRETVLLALPVSGQDVWKGRLSSASERQGWGKPFQLPQTDSPLTFTPVSWGLSNTPEGARYELTILTENPSEQEELVPDFAIDGQTAASPVEVFSGERVEKGDIRVQPKDTRYIHYSIPTELGKTLSLANVLTTESFQSRSAAGGLLTTAYAVGRVTISLQENGAAAGTAAPYVMGTSIALDPLNHYVHPDLAVSLVELNTHESDDDGYKTIIGKFELANNSGKPVALPAFQTELAAKNGLSYTGLRQSAVAQWVMPGTSHIVSYAFQLPQTDAWEDGYTLKLTDPQTAAPLAVTLAQLQVKVAPPVKPSPLQDLSQLAFYPYTITVHDWNISFFTNLNGVTLAPVTQSTKLSLDLDLSHKPNVIVDRNFSKIEFELMDSVGKKLSSRSIPLTGVNALIDGQQTIYFDELRINEQKYPLTVNIYETIETSNGSAKRLVAVLKESK